MEKEEVLFEPCEDEEFEENADFDPNIVEMTSEETDAWIRERKKQEKREHIKEVLVRVVFNTIVTAAVVLLALYFCSGD